MLKAFCQKTVEYILGLASFSSTLSFSPGCTLQVRHKPTTQSLTGLPLPSRSPSATEYLLSNGKHASLSILTLNDKEP